VSSQPASAVRLASHLWEATNILRGPVDAADFKTYVFPLLLFKRISDAHYEEYARFPQNYRFQIPGGCHWDDVRAIAAKVGQALQKAMRGASRRPRAVFGWDCPVVAVDDVILVHNAPVHKSEKRLSAYCEGDT